MKYKFEKLEVWKLAMQFNEMSYDLADSLPEEEKFNLTSQLKRTSTSIALNIAVRSTGQSDKEQAKFLSYSIRSHVEAIACIRLIEARGYIQSMDISTQNLETWEPSCLTNSRLLKKQFAKKHRTTVFRHRSLIQMN